MTATDVNAFPVTWDDPADAEKTWYFNAEHLPMTFTPLAFELVLAPFLRGFGWGMVPKLVNYYGYFAFDGPRDAAEPQVADVGYLRMAAARWSEQILPEVKGYIEYYRSHDFDALSDEELVAEIERLIEVRHRSGVLHTQSVTPYWLGHRLLIDTYKELIEDDELAALRLAQGYRNKSVEAGERLWELTQLAKSIPIVRERILAAQPDELCECFEQLESEAAAKPFVEAFRAYLDEFGWRSGNDEMAVTWFEDPTVPLTMLRTYLEMPDYDQPAEQRALTDEREQAVAAAMVRLDDAGRARLEEVLDVVRGVVTLSEDHNFFIDQRLVTTPRRLMQAFGRRLASKGVLQDEGLVLLLHARELLDALREGAGSLQEVCQQRSKDLKRFRKTTPPAFVGAAPAPGPGPMDGAGPAVPASDHPDELRGLPVSTGLVTGPVRVLTELSQANRLRPGDVLVTAVTSPPWTPLFAIASAIVTEVGGALSHTAVVAREYAIPAVASVKNATKLLRDGQLVEVDGSAGIVRLLG
jgi:pyruvate,water dikinase